MPTVWEPRDHLSEHVERRPSRAGPTGELVLRNAVNFWIGGWGTFVVCAALGWLVLLDPGVPVTDPDHLSARETWLFLAAVACCSSAAAVLFLNGSARSDGAKLTVKNGLRTHEIALRDVEIGVRPRLRWGFLRLTVRDGDSTRRITVSGMEQSFADTMAGGSESLALLRNEVESAHRMPTATRPVGVRTTWSRPSLPTLGVALYWMAFLAYAGATLHAA